MARLRFPLPIPARALLQRTSKAKGFGFGLSIAKMVIDSHGGTIEVRSEPGKGATIIMRLRLYMEKDKEI
jgi:signal transduction histidine kinase